MEGGFWNERIETLSAGEMRRLQWEKLKRQMSYCYDNSAFYRRKFEEAGVHPDAIKSVEEFRRLPTFLNKELDRELQEKTRQSEGHPFGEYLCTSSRAVRAVHSTSGTTGIPTFYAFSEKDIAVNNEAISRGFWRAGFRPGDYVIHGFGLSMWLAGIPILRALQHMGCLGIPCGCGGGDGAVPDVCPVDQAPIYGLHPFIC
jgi:phenylacetate-CoA ligase